MSDEAISFINSKARLTLSGILDSQELRYTTDGTDPTIDSALYEGQLELPEISSEGIEVRTRYFSKQDSSKQSSVTIIRFRSGD